MVIKSLKDKIIVPSLKDVVKIHLFSKFVQKGIYPYDNDLDIIAELFLFGGYKNTKEQTDFFNLCLNKKYKKSIQSIRNILTEYTKLEVLVHPKNLQLFVNEEFIPDFKSDKLVLQHIIGNAN